MSEENEVQVLYRNHQWMVQDEPKGHFVVEVSEHDPEDTESGYWIRAEDLKIVRDGWNMIEHVCEKTWVDIDAYEGAVKAALMLFGIRPDYDVAAKFREARRVRALHRQNEPGVPGLYRPSDLCTEVIELFGNGEDAA
jgi:hypothetical protein